MKTVLLAITLLFSVFLFAQKQSNQDVEKNRIIANVYAIVIDGENNFENFKGDLINTNNDVRIYKVKNQNDATKNFFTFTIKLDKALYNLLSFESNDQRGEFFFRTVEQAFDALVIDNKLTKKELKFPVGTETKATTYYSVDGISPVAYIWYKSTDPVLRYSIAICANESASVWVRIYVTANKISIPKPMNSIAKTAVKPIKKESNIAHQDLKKFVLESSSIENVKTTETKPQFATSYLQPNYIVDIPRASTLDNPDELSRQNGYRDYLKIVNAAIALTWGYGTTKEINFEKALALNTEAIRIFPNLSDAYIGRGQVYSRMGNAKAAQNDFDKAKQLAPYRSKYIDRAIATVEGREYIDPDEVNKSEVYYSSSSKSNTSTSNTSSSNTNSVFEISEKKAEELRKKAELEALNKAAWDSFSNRSLYSNPSNNSGSNQTTTKTTTTTKNGNTLVDFRTDYK